MQRLSKNQKIFAPYLVEATPLCLDVIWTIGEYASPVLVHKAKEYCRRRQSF